MWRYLRQYLPPPPRTRDGIGLALLPVFIAVLLLTLDRYGLQSAFVRSYAGALRGLGWDGNDIQFLAQVHFTASSVTLFVVMPLLYHALLPGQGSNPFGLSVRNCRPHLPAYLFLYIMMLPVLWFASQSPGFHQFYPLYKPASANMWLAYTGLYMLQFFALEFFFRGFALFRLERRMGLHAVTVMVVPYALIHVHKPFPEALASVPAGLVLGWLALKSRSIWPGVALHCAVALSMDVLAMLRSGRIANLM